MITSEGLYRVGVAVDILVCLIDIGITILLYQVLKPVNQTISLMAAAARLSIAILQGVNILNSLMALLAFHGEFGFVRDRILMMFYLNAHETCRIRMGCNFCPASGAAGIFSWSLGLSPGPARYRIGVGFTRLFCAKFWYLALSARQCVIFHNRYGIHD